MIITQPFTQTCYQYIAKLFAMSIAVAVFFIICTQTAAAQTPTVGSFSTTWQTDNPGSSATNQITIPTDGGSTYNYDIYWEDVNDAGSNGTITNSTDATTITFPSVGTYRVDITGTFPRILFDHTSDRQKILTIEQWGTLEWTSMERAFRGASNLTYNATDAPDLSGVTSLGGMFQEASSFTGDLDTWDLTTVTNLADMFKDASSFDGDLNSWGTTTANVESMFGMFDRARSFNQPLSDWDVSSVNNMAAMFKDATSFNQPLNSWDVSRVSDMFWMFWGATSFNQPLNSWNVSGVEKMEDMFNGATSFNQPLNSWDVSGVEDMENMFRNATAFNQPLNQWDISALSTTIGGFNDAFRGTAWDRDNYSAALQAWAALVNTPENITLRTDAQYTSGAQAARQALIDSNDWTITDGDLYIPPVVTRSSGGSSGTRICKPDDTEQKNCRLPRPQTVVTELPAVEPVSPILDNDNSELLARIAELQQLLAELQTRAGLDAGLTEISVPIISPTCDFTGDITTGSMGQDVTCLQQFLTTSGDYTWPEGPTGFFGPVTEQAVKSWQARVGVFPANGYFGPISRQAFTQ